MGRGPVPNALTELEKSRLETAGFAPTTIQQLDRVASQTPWLALRRFIFRRRNQYALGALTAALFVFAAFFVGTEWAFAIAFLPNTLLFFEWAWRGITAVRNPERRGARTAIALSVRADASDQGAAGWAYSALVDLAKASQKAEFDHPLLAINCHQQERDRHQAIAAAASLGALIVITVMVFVPVIMTGR